MKKMEKDRGGRGEITFIRIYAIPDIAVKVFLK